MKKFFIILLLIFLTTGCSENKIEKSFKQNGYSKKELTSLTSYSKDKISFTIAKDNSGTVISYENDEDSNTIVTTSTNNDVFSSFSCEYNFSTKKASTECNENEISEIKIARNYIEKELKKLGLTYKDLK